MSKSNISSLGTFISCQQELTYSNLHSIYYLYIRNDKTYEYPRKRSLIPIDSHHGAAPTERCGDATPGQGWQGGQGPGRKSQGGQGFFWQKHLSMFIIFFVRELTAVSLYHHFIMTFRLWGSASGIFLPEIVGGLFWCQGSLPWFCPQRPVTNHCLVCWVVRIRTPGILGQAKPSANVLVWMMWIIKLLWHHCTSWPILKRWRKHRSNLESKVFWWRSRWFWDYWGWSMPLPSRLGAAPWSTSL